MDAETTESSSEPTAPDTVNMAYQDDMSQFLSFFMDEAEYGIDILSVQEIRGWDKTTAVPNGPDFVKGVMNLRGTIVPVIDLRLRFNLQSIPYVATTVVIVVKVLVEGKIKVVGMVVDGVSDVYTIHESEASSPPEVGEHENSQFVRSLMNVGEKTLVLMNLESVLTF